MGLFSGGGFFGSGGKTNTGNTETRTNNFSNTQDFSGANTVYSSVSPVNIDFGEKAKDGSSSAASAGSVIIEQTDHGSIGEAMRLAEGATSGAYSFAEGVTKDIAAIANNSANNAYSLTGDAFAFADGAINTNAALVSQYGDLSTHMLNSSLSANGMVLDNAAQLIANQSDNNLNAALSMGELGYMQLMAGNDLAESLSNTSFLQQQDNNDSLNNGFKSMMQFADNVSRSDGANLAESTNKMFMVIGGLAGLGFIAWTLKGKK
ncbi:hypothetical protein [Colwellia sp. E2M01]|uniref:hypothetical protein n=1 Tax=Colwellia sp. E2M01 TaxID=2841561 RepID=UPI001C08F01F|nr:hypothetical protein [Colwellia sp. E2M01]MBU2871971.1 hypothetical protein [Colwellia sp. E2M01]